MQNPKLGEIVERTIDFFGERRITEREFFEKLNEAPELWNELIEESILRDKAVETARFYARFGYPL